jgi:hypothetical protein
MNNGRPEPWGGFGGGIGGGISGGRPDPTNNFGPQPFNPNPQPFNPQPSYPNYGNFISFYIIFMI